MDKIFHYDYEHCIKSTDNLDADDIDGILRVFHAAFDSKPHAENYFKWKYQDNPSGNSFHLITYCQDQLISSRAFWCLPYFKGWYQCVDTSVIPKFQNKGVFSSGTRFLKDNSDFRFYNAPNSHSYPQYIKHGWRINNILKPKIVNFKKASFVAPYIAGSDMYIEWRYTKHPFFDYRQASANGVYYLFRIKRKIPVLLGYTYLNPKLKEINPFYCCYYGEIEGIALEFGALTHCLAYPQLDESIQSYHLDMM